MPLELIYGPAGSGKTDLAIREFLEAADSGGQALFIAPSLPDARHFQRRVLGVRPVLAAGKITTFNSVFENIAGPGARRVITPLERRVLLREAIRKSRPAGALAQSCVYEGFVSQLADLISELEALDINPAGLGEAIKGWAGRDSWRRGFNQEFFRIHDEYRSLLAELDAISPEQAQRQAAGELMNSPERLGADLVIIDGFRDFTPAERIFVEAVRGSETRLLVTLPYAGWHPAYTATGIVFSSLAEGAATRPLKEADDGRHPALAHLLRHLFQEGAPQAPADGAVAILEAAALRGQGERVAAEILKLWRSGVALDDMAVVTRSHGPDSAAIADACRDFGIPIEVDSPVPLSDTPVGMTALAALQLISRPEGPAQPEGLSSAGSILAYLRSPLAGADSSQVDDYERRLHQPGAGLSGAKEWRRLWEEQTGNTLSEIDRLNGARDRGLPSLAAELCGLMRELMMGSTGVEAGIAEISEDVLAMRQLDSVCQSVGALEENLGALREGNQTGGGAAGGAFELEPARMLAEVIRQSEVRLPAGARRGCVRLLDPHRMLNQRFDVVFICSLLEGQFPAATRENAFFTDADRVWLRDHKGPALDTHQNWLEEERFLFHRTVSRARKKVYLCYPVCDEEGKPTINSLLVDDVRDLFETDSLEIITRGIGDTAFSPGEAPTEDQALLALSLASRGQPTEVSAPAPLKQRFADCLAAARPRGFALSDQIRSRFRELEHFRVTELEDYLKCPFGYFIRRVVQAQPLEEDTFALKRGAAVHEIMKEFFKVLGRADMFLPQATQEQLDEARRIMAGIINDKLASAGGDLRGLVMKNHLRHHLDRFIEREMACRTQFKPYRFEWGFGICDGKPQGRFDEETMLSFGGVKICGRIDRVDLMEGTNKAVVIDYKTSADSNIHGHASFERKALLQVPIYMMAVRDILGLEPVGGEYYGILGSKRRGLYLSEYAEAVGSGSGELTSTDLVDAGQFEERIEEAREAAIRAAEGIRAADFACRPADVNVCSYCGMGDICRMEEADPSGQGTWEGGA